MVSPIRGSTRSAAAQPQAPISFGVHNGTSKGKKFEIRPKSEFYVLGTVPESTRINGFVSFDSKLAGGAKGPAFKLEKVAVYEVEKGTTGKPSLVVPAKDLQANADGSFTLSNVDLPHARSGKFVLISTGTVDGQAVRIQSKFADTGDV